jgi:hypothetical protein
MSWEYQYSDKEQCAVRNKKTTPKNKIQELNTQHPMQMQKETYERDWKTISNPNHQT